MNRIIRLFILFPCLAASFFTCKASFGSEDPAVLEFVDEESKTHSGLIPQSVEEYQKLEMAKTVRSFSKDESKPYQNLPRKIDLSVELPSPGDQGRQNSCTAWAVAYAVKSLHEKRELGWDFNSKHLFSPAFVYNQVNNGADKGASLRDAIGVVIHQGAVPLSLMPYREGDFKTQPTGDLKKIASFFGSLGHRRLNEKDVPQIKSFLAAGEPVILAVATYKNFLPRGMLRSGNVYREKAGRLLGAHAVVAVGYDDDKNAVKILNSWGKDWGEKGYGWIDYRLFPEVVVEAHVLYDKPTPREAVAYLDSPPGSAVIVRPSAPPPSPIALSSRPSVLSRLKDPVLIVPNEAGLKIGEKWLRIGNALTDANDAFQLDPSQAGRLKTFDPIVDEVWVTRDLFAKERIGRFRFYRRGNVSVSTNEGVAFGSTREDVLRIYRVPDYVDPRTGGDTYFFHSISRDWGGIPVTTHIALGFSYNEQDHVDEMVLGSVVKESVLGTGYVPLSAGEQTKTPEGVRIESPEGGIAFTVPENFSEVKKADYEGTGVGYFIREPGRISGGIAVLAFLKGRPVTDEDLNERIKADLASDASFASTEIASLEKTSFGGLEWKTARRKQAYGEGVRIHYYAFKGSRLYQIKVTTAEDPAVATWVEPFLRSISIR